MALILESVAVSLDRRPLIRRFSLRIEAGEIVCLMGPSGAGKSSLLGLIAGDLAAPFEGAGQVRLDGRDLGGLAPERRRIGRLFQDDLLFPHLTVGENLLFGMARGAQDARLAAMRAGLKAIDLEAFEDRPPHSLSGGQRSRVALMRALLAEPAAMLLDEPFNKLDADLRQSLRGLVFRHLQERAIPTLLVTHDRADAPPGGRVLTITRAGEVRDD